MLLVVASNFVVFSRVVGDIYRWDNGERITETIGITPQPLASLDRMNLDYAYFAPGTDLAGSFFTESSLVNATLMGANFSDAVIAGVDLSGATERGFTREQFFSTQTVRDHWLDGITMRNTNLSGWSLVDLRIFSSSDFSGSNFTNTDLTGTRIDDEPFFFGADFRGARNLDGTTTTMVLTGYRIQRASVSMVSSSISIGTTVTYFPFGITTAIRRPILQLHQSVFIFCGTCDSTMMPIRCG